MILLFLSFGVAVGCGGGEGGGTDAAEPEVEADDIEIGGAQTDFTATSISATPNELLQTQLITIDATITNTGSTASGNFEVRAFLKRGTNCNDTSFFLGAQTISLDGLEAAPFQVSRVIDNVTATGTYYLCIHMDALGDVPEANESNNLIGGTTYPVYVVNCLSDPSCDDLNPCTDDLCVAQVGCQHNFNIAPCDDGLFCTLNDVCQSGVCQAGLLRDCADVNVCDGEMLCDEQAGACVNGQPPVSCDDGNACNGVETCNPTTGACLAGAPIACDNLINNALAPPTTSNVLDDASFDPASQQRVLVRNQGCPLFGEPDSFCPIAGTPTEVEVVAGGDVGDLTVLDESDLLVSGGAVANLSCGQSASMTLDGGNVAYGLSFGSSTITAGVHDFLELHGPSTIMGGTIQDLELDSKFAHFGGGIRGGEITTLFAGENSAVRGGQVSVLCARFGPSVVYGSGFNLNFGNYGTFPGDTGFVTGLLELGDTLSATYHQGTSWCYHPVDGVIDASGSFMLLPPESTFYANGLSPAYVQNIVNAGDPATQFHDVFVRNANCPDAWPDAMREDPCTLPGAPTSIEVHMGAHVPGNFWVRDASQAIVRGGQLDNLRMSASARIEVWGDSFTINGSPVPFGEISATTGVLAGFLASGESFSSNFDREDPQAAGTYGTIFLQSAADLAAGSGVTGNLFGGAGTIGGVAVNLEVETSGTLSGSYKSVNLGAIRFEIPDFDGLAMAAQSVQGQYQIWDLGFTGELNSAGYSRVTFVYDPALVAPGQQLIIYGWNGLEWLRVDDGVVIDELNNTITVVISNFTLFALVIREYTVPALSIVATVALTFGLAASGVLARGRRSRGGRS